MESTITPKNRGEWRAWLERHHGSAKEIRLIFFKIHTGRESITYDEAVEEAICFGWIDGVIRRIDDERYSHKFTPRGEKTVWSRTNVSRAEKMIREGRMTEAGFRKYRGSKIRQDRPANPVLPAELKRILNSDSTASANFERLPPSHRKQYILWITNAKKDETRLKRLQEAIERLRRGESLGMK
jgi:uncharacterized protein YdeI (YjbR/CyaY-like superfamily)